MLLLLLLLLLFLLLFWLLSLLYLDCTGHNPDFKISIKKLGQIHSRRFNMSRTALEIFLVDQTNYFINFPDKKVNTVGVKIKFPLHVRSTYIERRNVITIVQRYAKSTVLPLGYCTHQLVFIIPQSVAIGFRT